MRFTVILLMLLFMGLTPASAQGNPQAVVSAFLESWNNRNYDGMYNQISEKSRALVAFPVFETTYREADAAMGLSSLTFTVQDTMVQGASAAVTYDLTLESTIFGTIQDSGRIMRLMQEPRGWRIAWSTMDIFDGMTAAAQIRAFGLREPRASIYDRNGLPLVEQDGSVVSLYVSRQEIPNEAGCLDLLANLLRRQRQDLFALFDRYNFETIFYVGEINDDVFNSRQAELAETCAIRTLERQTRRYYRGNAVSHVTGYIGQIPADELAEWEARGYLGGELVGRTGIERAFEEELAGQPSRQLQVVEPGGTVLRELGATEGTAPLPVTLTIDRDLQAAAAQTLADAYNFAEGNWGNRNVSTGASLVVVDIHTGAILAMASYPLYEPDVFSPDTNCCTPMSAGDRISDLVADQRSPLLNRVVQQQYFPGSVYKIVTTAAAAAEGLFGPDEIFDCGLTWNGVPYGDTVGFERVDWRLTDGLEATGPVNIAQALTSSCDPFYYQMGAELYNRVGEATLVEYSRRMGLGRPTGIDYYGQEAAGQLPVPNSTAAAINNAIGQGDVKVSVLQMAHLVAGVANGGTLYQPYLVARVGGADSTPVAFEAQPEVVGDMQLSEEILTLVRDGMCGVTSDEVMGTAYSAFADAQYQVCGKTGTAQTDRYPSAWFVAYAPADNPRIAVAAMAEQSREGSEIAAPMVRRVIDAYLNEPWQGFPLWWNTESYVPVQIPEGATGG